MNDMSESVSVAESDAQQGAILDALLDLPQSAHFKPEHIKRFIDIYGNDPRALWHTRRLSGIGGSEIGILVAALRGEQDVFGETPADLIRSKLLIYPPKKQTLAMRRGIVAETCLRKFFLEDFKAERDMGAIETLESGACKRPEPWMRYSPDDVVVIGGKRYMVDYKHPAEASLHDDVYLRYICQLHMGKMVADYNGIAIDGLLLVQFPQNGNDSDLQVSDVTFDDEIADDIVTAGRAVWGDILKGSAPPFPLEDDGLPHQLTDNDISELNDLAAQFVKSKAMGERLTEDARSAQDQIAQIIRRRALPDGKVALPGLNVSVKAEFDGDVAAQAIGDDAAQAAVPVYSTDLMAGYLVAAGTDMSQFETGKRVKNNAKLLQMLPERMLTKEQFEVRKLRMTLNCNNEYKEAAQIAAIGARDNFQLAVESKPGKTQARKMKL